jgi:hypothetical protein
VSSGPDENPRYVTVDLCNERFMRIIDKLEILDKRISELRSEQARRARDWRLFFMSVASGVVVALVTWLLSRL